MFKRLITVHHYHDVSFSPKTTKPGNEDLFNTKGQGSAGEEVSSGWGGGGGGKCTYRNRYLISDLIRCCQATNDEKPAFSLLQPQRKFHGLYLKSTFHVFFLENTKVQNPF